MSKQSRAKSRRHKKPTGKKAPTFVEVISSMDEATRYYVLGKMRDELHDILCARQKFWGSNSLNLFFCEQWWQLTELVKEQRESKSKVRALEILSCLKAYPRYF